MATIQGVHVWIAKGVLKSTWASLLNGDVGSPLDAPNLPDKTVQIKGTFGTGGSINIEGSNDGGTTNHILNDSRGEGNPLTLTLADTRTINENPAQIRPNVTAGDANTSLTVIIISQAPRR